MHVDATVESHGSDWCPPTPMSLTSAEWFYLTVPWVILALLFRFTNIAGNAEESPRARPLRADYDPRAAARVVKATGRAAGAGQGGKGDAQRRRPGDGSSSKGV